jgi:hypothetical protein
VGRVQGIIERFPARQGLDGYFKSQQGDWDSNGQVLWLMEQFCRITGRGLNDDLVSALRKGGEWILEKRLPDDGLSPHAGLMPAGFSAEHLGHNDYYFWDDFWSVAGLTAAGFNIYLSLHCAQVLLRAGDRRFWSIFRKASDLASATGQWPEAIHPHTLGGCQGDGQHIWTSADWVMMLVHMFVREENGGLILLSGIPPEWLVPNRQIHFGPVQTPFGRLILSLHRNRRGVCMEWTARWRRRPETLSVRLAGYVSADLEPDDSGGVGLMAI